MNFYVCGNDPQLVQKSTEADVILRSRAREARDRSPFT